MATSFVVAPLADGRQALVLREERDTACLVFDPNQRTLQPLPALPVGEGGPACEVQDGPPLRGQEDFVRGRSSWPS
jgi:hypothetical protein